MKNELIRRNYDFEIRAERMKRKETLLLEDQLCMIVKQT